MDPIFSFRKTLFFVFLYYIKCTHATNCQDANLYADKKHLVSFTFVQQTEIVPVKIYTCYCYNKTVIAARQSDLLLLEEGNYTLNREECLETIKTGKFRIPNSNKYYSVKMNGTVNYTFEEYLDDNSHILINTSLTFNEYVTNADLIGNKVFLRSGFDKCFYDNFTCLDDIEKVVVFWNAYSSTGQTNKACAGFLLLYKGPGFIVTLNKRPQVQSIIVEQGEKAFGIHLEGNKTICGNFVYITDITNQYVSFDLKNISYESNNHLVTQYLLNFKPKEAVYADINQHCKAKHEVMSEEKCESEVYEEETETKEVKMELLAMKYRTNMMEKKFKEIAKNIEELRVKQIDINEMKYQNMILKNRTNIVEKCLKDNNRSVTTLAVIVVIIFIIVCGTICLTVSNSYYTLGKEVENLPTYSDHEKILFNNCYRLKEFQ